jgi:hypothetical protein
VKARQEARAAETAASQKNNGKPKKRKDRGEFEGVEIKREGECFHHILISATKLPSMRN